MSYSSEMEILNHTKINTVVSYEVFLQVKMLGKAAADSASHCEHSRLRGPLRFRGDHTFLLFFFFSAMEKEKHLEKHKSKNM